MSFVGTRPEAVKYVEKYKPEYLATLLLPAGITSEASIRYKDEAQLLDVADDVDRVYMITCDVRAFQKNRELFQPYIDGGMYAQSVLNALYYKGIGAIPLSASLAGSQEKKIRKKVGINKSEVFILFIGVGTYPDSCKTTRSERMPVDIRLV